MGAAAGVAPTMVLTQMCGEPVEATSWANLEAQILAKAKEVQQWSFTFALPPPRGDGSPPRDADGGPLPELQTKPDPEAEKRAEEESAAAGTYASSVDGTKVTYRVRVGGSFGGYKVVEATANQGLTRTQLLDLRSKKKGDRRCM